MSEKKFVQPLPIYQQTLKRLQWDGKYWGENGALEYARRNSDLVNLTPVSLISLRYSAATSAWVRWKKNPLLFWWLLRFLFCFYPAFASARELVQTQKSFTLTPEECSVVGVVLARGKLRDLAIRVFEHGLSQINTDNTDKFETAALIYADLYEIHAMPAEKVWMFVWGFTHAPYGVEQAKRVRGKIDPQQLCRVLRKIGLKQFANQYAFELESWDQVLKSR